MKKTKNAPVEHDEEYISSSVHDRVAAAAKKKQEESLRDALKRVGLKHSVDGNPAKGKPSYGMSAHESEQDLFAMMDSFLSEKIFSMLEAKINPDNMISPDAKLSGKTPVVASAEGIPPAQYAQAQGVVGTFQTKMSENETLSEMRRYRSSYDPNRDYKGGAFKFRKKERDEEPVRPKSSQKDSGFHPMKVGFADKDKAKAEGMKWHPEKKVWYHTSAEKANNSSFQRHEG